MPAGHCLQRTSPLCESAPINVVDSTCRVHGCMRVHFAVEDYYSLSKHGISFLLGGKERVRVKYPPRSWFQWQDMQGHQGWGGGQSSEAQPKRQEDQSKQPQADPADQMLLCWCGCRTRNGLSAPEHMPCSWSERQARQTGTRLTTPHRCSRGWPVACACWQSCMRQNKPQLQLGDSSSKQQETRCTRRCVAW